MSTIILVSVIIIAMSSVVYGLLKLTNIETTES